MLSPINICRFLLVFMFAANIFCAELNYSDQSYYYAINEQLLSVVRCDDLISLKNLLKTIEKDERKILLKGALIEATNYSNYRVIPYLLEEEHCDPNDKDQYGNTFVHIALLKKMPALIIILEKIELDYNEKNELGMSIFDYAKIAGNDYCINFIKKKGGRLSFDGIFLPILKAALNEDWYTLKYYYDIRPTTLPLPINVANFIFCFLFLQGDKDILDEFMRNEKIDQKIIDYFINVPSFEETTNTFSYLDQIENFYSGLNLYDL